MHQPVLQWALWAATPCGSQPGGQRSSRDQELLCPQAAPLILAYCGEGVGEAPTGLAGVKSPAPQPGPERLCC